MTSKLRWARKACDNSRYRAAQKGIPHTISTDQIMMLTFPKCPVLGVPLDYAGGHGSGPRPFTASLDRIVPSLGYVPGNVHVISQRANSIKRDAVLSDLQAITAWVERYQPPQGTLNI